MDASDELTSYTIPIKIAKTLKYSCRPQIGESKAAVLWNELPLTLNETY